jgi:hypothetical protein
MLIQYIPSYPPCPTAVSSVHITKTRHDLEKGTYNTVQSVNLSRHSFCYSCMPRLAKPNVNGNDHTKYNLKTNKYFNVGEIPSPPTHTHTHTHSLSLSLFLCRAEQTLSSPRIYRTDWWSFVCVSTATPLYICHPRVHTNETILLPIQHIYCGGKGWMIRVLLHY